MQNSKPPEVAWQMREHRLLQDAGITDNRLSAENGMIGAYDRIDIS